MADNSKIEWTDATWNPIRGCARVSEGCRNCYAERVSARFSGPGQPYEGIAAFVPVKNGAFEKREEARWSGVVNVVQNKIEMPIRWYRPRRIFVNSMSDLFYERLPDVIIDEIFTVMALADQHQYQVLTKRVKRMREYTKSKHAAHPGEELARRIATRAAIRAEEKGFNTRIDYFQKWLDAWPLPHIWLGASAENQSAYDARRRDLENTDAAVIWWSLEPLIGPIRLTLHESGRKPDWIVAGGESGMGARPMHPDWVKQIRDECAKHNVPFFFKQWGEWSSDVEIVKRTEKINVPCTSIGNLMFWRVGKFTAGRTFDGAEWSQYPERQTK